MRTIMLLVALAGTLAVPVFGQVEALLLGATRRASGAPSYLLSNGFEGTGTEDGVWTNNAGTVQFDYSSPSSNVIDGAQSCYAPSYSDAWSGGFGGARSELWLFAKLRLQAHSSGDSYFFRLYGGGAQLMRLRSTGSSIVCEAGNSNKSVSVSLFSNYCVWAHYKKGSGADSIGQWWITNTTTRPAVPTVQTANGTNVFDAAYIYGVGINWNTGFWLDSVRVSATEIGDNPE